MNAPQLIAPLGLLLASLVVFQTAADVHAAKRKPAADRSTVASSFRLKPRKLRRGPDLIVRKYVISGPKSVRVLVANIGNKPAGASRLRLTVRRINGTPVGRMTYAKTPPIAAKKQVWVSMSAKKILPLAVKLSATTFRLDADASNVVKETKEKNNTKWHNLP